MSLPIKKITSRGHPETDLWRALRTLMQRDGWYVKKMHGSKFQSGLPDVYASHRQFGERWIELKVDNNTLEQSQISEFGKMSAGGCRIFILRKISEYPDVLFRAPNWAHYGMNKIKTVGVRK